MPAFKRDAAVAVSIIPPGAGQMLGVAEDELSGSLRSTCDGRGRSPAPKGSRYLPPEHARGIPNRLQATARGPGPKGRSFPRSFACRRSQRGVCPGRLSLRTQRRDRLNAVELVAIVAVGPQPRYGISRIQMIAQQVPLRNDEPKQQRPVRRADVFGAGSLVANRRKTARRRVQGHQKICVLQPDRRPLVGLYGWRLAGWACVCPRSPMIATVPAIRKKPGGRCFLDAARIVKNRLVPPFIVMLPSLNAKHGHPVNGRLAAVICSKPP